MCNDVIFAKYLRRDTMVEWIRNPIKAKKGISTIWNSLIHSFTILGDWLVWRPGNGTQIRVGEDPLVGFPSYFKLSIPLLNLLHEKGFFLSISN